ncbi:baseplate assembly protein [Pectobacterium colocasium]|uniref:baseplate assembly protein n=1 Tax=Pectobacterium colocasium TaxID=2878098 RepID=UPI003B28D866
MAVTTEPVFIERDAAKITAELIAKYEADSGKTLYPAQAERLLIDLMAYREMLVRSAIQDAAKQNLVRYARAPMLDYLGELVGTYRLAALAGQTTLQFSVESALLTDTLIPAGTRVSASDSVLFATDSDVIMKAGTLSATVAATCTQAGLVGNNWQPAQISTLVDEIDDIDFTVRNLTASVGGSDEETDDRLRERIQLAPESFSTAGSKLAYRYHALSAHPDIVDVAVVRAEPGTVHLYPLLSTGLPDDSVLAQVISVCSDEKVRPLTDTVAAKSPVPVEYSLHARLTLKRDVQALPVKQAAQQAALAWTERRRATLGQDIVPSQINAALLLDGVYSVELLSPALLVLDDWQLAICTDIAITIAGAADE